MFASKTRPELGGNEAVYSTWAAHIVFADAIAVDISGKLVGNVERDAHF